LKTVSPILEPITTRRSPAGLTLFIPMQDYSTKNIIAAAYAKRLIAATTAFLYIRYYLDMMHMFTALTITVTITVTINNSLICFCSRPKDNRNLNTKFLTYCKFTDVSRAADA